MTTNRSKNSFLSLPLYRYPVGLAIALVLGVAGLILAAQSGGTIPAGVDIPVRLIENINVNHSDGLIFSGQVDQNVRDARGQVALPRGSMVELVVRQIGDEEYLLDLESVQVNGQRLAVESETGPVIQTDDDEGIGKNKRTGKYIGGGAVIGAIIGAIAGGGKGAAIGAGAGAAAGAGAQTLTKGKSVNVPSESLVTFRLERPLRTGIADTGFSRNGRHYHPGYGMEAGNSVAFDDGVQAGRADRQRRVAFNSRTRDWTGDDLRDYQDGYARGFDETPSRAKPGAADIQIGANRYIRWNGPAEAKVYYQIDNGPRQLFAVGASGDQPAPWITYGHRYIFYLVDARGREIARDENDLRNLRRSS
jgi:hypothetical protein